MSAKSQTSAASRVPIPQNDTGSNPAKMAIGNRAAASCHGTATPAACINSSICQR